MLDSGFDANLSLFSFAVSSGVDHIPESVYQVDSWFDLSNQATRRSASIRYQVSPRAVTQVAACERAEDQKLYPSYSARQTIIPCTDATDNARHHLAARHASAPTASELNQHHAVGYRYRVRHETLGSEGLYPDHIRMAH